MDIVRLNESLIEIDGKVRIERGPKLKVAVATDDLLSDAVTASHYQVGGADAHGVEIQIGASMTYLDWLGESCWYIYALDGEAWNEVETVDGDELAALSRASAYL